MINNIFFVAKPQNAKVNLEIVLKNQKIMLQRQTKFQISLDTLTSLMCDYFDRPTCDRDFSNVSNVSQPVVESSGTLPFEPIDSVEKLTEFEEKLKNETYMNEIVESMAFICGKSGTAIGLDCCYKLIDYFLTRNFVTQCSWTGNTRLGPGIEKVPLKFFESFRKCFRSIITLADSKFTETECEDFFKRVMKNSIQRQKSGTIRQSKHKRRPKNLKYNNMRTWRKHEFEHVSRSPKEFESLDESGKEANEMNESYIKIDLDFDHDEIGNEAEKYDLPN